MVLATAVVFAGFGTFEIYNGIESLALFLFPLGIVIGSFGFFCLRIAKKEQLENTA